MVIISRAGKEQYEPGTIYDIAQEELKESWKYVKMT